MWLILVIDVININNNFIFLDVRGCLSLLTTVFLRTSIASTLHTEEPQEILLELMNISSIWDIVL